MMSGIVVAMIFSMLIMPAIGVDRSRWLVVMCVLSALAFLLTLLECYYTKERVTLETADDPQTRSIPCALQLKEVFTDRYTLIILACFLIYTLGTSLKNLSLVYYCNYVLGTYNDGITQMLVSVIGGIPMGIGIFAVAVVGVCTGIFNALLAGAGYVAPTALSATQNAAVRGVITFSFVGLEVITGLVLIGLLVFLTVEKTVEKKQAEIRDRQKAARVREKTVAALAAANAERS